MKKETIIDELAKKLNLSYEETFDLYEAYFKSIKKLIEEGEKKVVISDTLVFKLDVVLVHRRLCKLVYMMRIDKAKCDFRTLQSHKEEFKNVLRLRKTLIDSGEWNKKIQKTYIQKKMLEDYNKYLKDGSTRQRSFSTY